MSGDCEVSKELEFRYESNAASSFLVIGCRTRILDFQAKMLENNAIRYIVPLETVKAEGICHFYYNITSLVNLQIFLKRYELNRTDFLKLLLNLSSCISNSEGYLLSASNFIYDPEYVYIEPDTMEARLIYIPAEADGHDAWTFQSLVSDVLMKHIDRAGLDRNLVQRILSEVRSDMFSIRSFMILINELLYGGRTCEPPATLPEPGIYDRVLEKSCKNDKIEEKREDKENKETKSTKISLPLLVPAVLLQIVMGLIIFLSRGFLDNVGKNRTTTYLAVLMIVMAIDVLVFRKLQAMKLFRAYSTGHTDRPAQKDELGTGDDKAAGPGKIRLGAAEEAAAVIRHDKETSAAKARERLKRLTGSITEERMQYTAPVAAERTETTAREEIASIYSQKTEILSSNDKKVHMLKSKRKYTSDLDIIVDKEEIIVGRLRGHVDRVLLNNAVGKLHAVLLCRNGTCFVKDLNSVNGTYVNGIRIESNKEVELKNNDSLRFADSEYVYICSGS